MLHAIPRNVQARSKATFLRELDIFDIANLTLA